MIKKHSIESQLHCKATAELNKSVEEDLIKQDASLKELLDDRSLEEQQESSDTSFSEPS